MQQDYWRREIIIAASAFMFGFFVLPFAIYWVGQQIVGDYTAESGVWSLAEHIWSDLLFLRPAAWILVFSPYLVLQLMRFAYRLWRPKSV